MVRFVVLVAALMFLGTPASAQIVIDGNSADWAGVAPVAQGELTVRITDDGETLYLLIETTEDFGAPSSFLSIDFDLDRDPATSDGGSEATLLAGNAAGGVVALADTRNGLNPSVEYLIEFPPYAFSPDGADFETAIKIGGLESLVPGFVGFDFLAEAGVSAQGEPNPFESGSYLIGQDVDKLVWESGTISGTVVNGNTITATGTAFFAPGEDDLPGIDYAVLNPFEFSATATATGFSSTFRAPSGSPQLLVGSSGGTFKLTPGSLAVGTVLTVRGAIDDFLIVEPTLPQLPPSFQDLDVEVVATITSVEYDGTGNWTSYDFTGRFDFTGTLLPGHDSDNDCIADSVESALGTNPNHSDTDRDGLFDGWEIDSLDHQSGCSPLQVDLPALGADPLTPDVFLQIDWMELDQNGDGDTNDPGEHSHRPHDEVKLILEQAFSRQGISLHIELGNPVPHESTTSFDLHEVLGELESDFDRIKAAHFDGGRELIFHYALFAHRLSVLGFPIGNSGMAEIVGDDLIVTLADFANQVGSLEQQAGTLMHELGHNLGLRHGGGDDENCKPQHLSVMNYLHQHRGVCFDDPCTENHRFDFSSRSLSLDEEHLDETSGVNFGTSDRIYWTCPGFNPDHRDCLGNANRAQVADGTPIDWNCKDGDQQIDVEADINGDDIENVLVGYDDWASLVFDFKTNPGNIGSGVRTNVTPPGEELDAVTANALALDHQPRKVSIKLLNHTIVLHPWSLAFLVVLSDSEFDPAEVIVPTAEAMGSTDPLFSVPVDWNRDGTSDVLIVYPVGSMELLTPAASRFNFSAKTKKKEIVLGETSVRVRPAPWWR